MFDARWRSETPFTRRWESLMLINKKKYRIECAPLIANIPPSVDFFRCLIYRLNVP